MQQRVLGYIREQRMIETGDRILIGVSGGADSICLMHILMELRKELDFTLDIIHVNHNLRGDEAKRDQQFVEKLCQTYHLPYKTYSIDVGGIANQEGIGLEEAGRKVRYAAFLEHQRCCGANKVALAHHKNDVAETMLYNLARGSKIPGLCSIKSTRNQYIRPLLCMNRKEIEHYLEEHHIQYVTDSSNFSLDYTRNKVRHQVIDYLEKEVNPQVVTHMAQFSAYLEDVEQYLQEQARREFEHFVVEDAKGVLIHQELLASNKIIVMYVLRLSIQKVKGELKNITQVHLEELYHLFQKEVGKSTPLPGNFFAKRVYTGVLVGNGVFEDSVEKERSMKVPISMVIPGITVGKGFWVESSIISEKSPKITEKIYTKWLDYGKIKDNIVLRTRKSGDYLVINQDGGTKKLKDYFINEKIPREEREHIWLLAQGHEILWVIGYRISEAYKVTRDTKAIIKIQVTGGRYRE